MRKLRYDPVKIEKIIASEKSTQTHVCIDTVTCLAMLFLFICSIAKKCLKLLTDDAVGLGETKNTSACICISALTMRLILNNIACHSKQNIQNGIKEIQEAYHNYNILSY